MLHWSQNLSEVYTQSLIANYSLSTVTEKSYWDKFKELPSFAWEFIGGKLDHW